MLKKEFGSGCLKKNYHFKITMAKLKSTDKFLCSKIVKVDDATVERVIKSKKYLVKGLIIGEDKIENLSLSFDEKNKFKYNETYFNQDNTAAIFAFKNIVNGKEIVEMCMVKTFRRKDSISVSLYYLPNGSVINSCFIARYCMHKTNEHKNSDGTIIPKGVCHMHKASEKYFEYAFKKYRKNEKEFVTKLQSPDAIEKPNIKSEEQLVQEAMKEFNIKCGREIEAYSEVKQKKRSYWINGKEYKGQSDKTIVENMGEAMEQC